MIILPALKLRDFGIAPLYRSVLASYNFPSKVLCKYQRILGYIQQDRINSKRKFYQNLNWFHELIIIYNLLAQEILIFISYNPILKLFNNFLGNSLLNNPTKCTRLSVFIKFSELHTMYELHKSNNRQKDLIFL